MIVYSLQLFLTVWPKVTFRATIIFLESFLLIINNFFFVIKNLNDLNYKREKSILCSAYGAKRIKNNNNNKTLIFVIRIVKKKNCSLSLFLSSFLSLYLSSFLSLSFFLSLFFLFLKTFIYLFNCCWIV